MAPAAVAKLPFWIALVRCCSRADRLKVELLSSEKARVSALHLRAGYLGLGLTLQASDSCGAWMPSKQDHKGMQQRPFLSDTPTTD